jgi:hypothetical protein
MLWIVSVDCAEADLAASTSKETTFLLLPLPDSSVWGDGERLTGAGCDCYNNDHQRENYRNKTECTPCVRHGQQLAHLSARSKTVSQSPDGGSDSRE